MFSSYCIGVAFGVKNKLPPFGRLFKEGGAVQWQAAPCPPSRYLGSQWLKLLPIHPPPSSYLGGNTNLTGAVPASWSAMVNLSDM